MPAIITNDLRIANGDYFQNDMTEIPMYVYFGGTTAWDDESNPPDTIDSTQGKFDAIKEVVGLKRIFSSDMISVLPRNNWTIDTVYDEYTDKANILDDKNPVTNDYYKFYVVTDEFNVYKCLSNNLRSSSTIKPTGVDVTTFQTPDGYVWKYMYTIKSEDAFKFMSPNWIPCYSILNDDGSQQWQVQQSAIDGSIEHIVVVDGGNGYLSTDNLTVTISGDGSGAIAVPEVNDSSGQIEKIIVTSKGSGYTNATILISGGSGIGVSAEIVISPIGGHGANARNELGATYKMIRTVIESDESGVLPIGISYRKAGILLEPLSNDSGVSLNLQSTKLFTVGDTVTGETSGATGTIRSINSISNKIFLESVFGTFIDGENVSSTNYNLTQIQNIKIESNIPLNVVVANSSDYAPLTGSPLYFSNREAVSRGINQIEEFRFILSM